MTLLLDTALLSLLGTTRQPVPANCNIQYFDDRHKSQINETWSKHFLIMKRTGSCELAKKISFHSSFFHCPGVCGGENCFCQVAVGSDPIARASY